jgi:predicted MFS family arabinose efflux permease
VPTPLKSPRLRRIIVAYTVNRLGTWIGVVALSLAVFNHTRSALAVAAVLVAAQALPAFVVPAVVARVEASERGAELTALYFFEAVMTAALAVLMWHFSLPAVLLLATLDGTAALAASALLRSELARAARNQLESPPAGETGASPDIEAQEHAAEREANAALNVAFSVTFVLGPLIGSAIVAGAGAPSALFVDAGSFLICGALLVDLHPHVEDAAGESVRARLLAAWKHLSEAPVLRKLLLTDAVALIFLNAAWPIQVSYAKDTLRVGDRGFGLLLATWGAGAVVGSLVFSRSLRRPLGTMLSAGVLAIGAAYVGLGAAPSLALACVAAFVGGVGNGVEVPALISLVQRLTPQPLQGRLMGAVESIDALCLAVGLPLGGVLVVLSSPRVAFLTVGLGAAATAVVLFRILQAGPSLTADTQAPAPAAANADGRLNEALLQGDGTHERAPT